MIDTELIETASTPLECIKQIDSSWRDYVEKLKENIFRVPFESDYSLHIENGYILIEGFSGNLVINRLYHNQTTQGFQVFCVQTGDRGNPAGDDIRIWRRNKQGDGEDQKISTHSIKSPPGETRENIHER